MNRQLLSWNLCRGQANRFEKALDIVFVAKLRARCHQRGGTGSDAIADRFRQAPTRSERKNDSPNHAVSRANCAADLNFCGRKMLSLLARYEEGPFGAERNHEDCCAVLPHDTARCGYLLVARLARMVRHRA